MNKRGAVGMTLQEKGLAVSSDNLRSMSGSNTGSRELIPTGWEDRPMTWGCVSEGRHLPVGEKNRPELAPVSCRTCILPL